MTEKFKKFFSKFRLNRAAAVTAVTLIIAMAMIVAITVAANRAKKNQIPPDDDTSVTTTASGGTSSGTTTTPGTTTSRVPVTSTTRASSTSTSHTPAAAEIPTFVLPTTGAMLKGHDLTIQVFSNTMNDYRVHKGIDIASTLGAPVYAAADGTVEKVWEDVSYGICLSILHDGDSKTVYKNLDPNIPEGIAAGAKVKSGQLIAAVGESAMVEVADEPHLHFELYVGDEAADPTEYFDSASVAVLDKDIGYEG